MSHEIRIGTLTPLAEGGHYIKQILEHGFESLQVTNWQYLPKVDLKELAKDVKDAVGDRAVISSLGMFGNPLMDKQTAEDIAKAIDAARDFNCDLVCGFTGAINGKSVPDNMPEFKKLWTDLAKRCEDRGVRFAFENCDMGGYWNAAQWNIAHASTAWEMMFNEVPSKALGIEWEPCHHMGSFVDPIAQLRKLAPTGKLFHLHGKDATIAHDVVREYGTRSGKPYIWHRHPGFGDTNWTDIITILRQNKFVGSIDIEGWHDPVYKDHLETTGQVYALNYLKQCRGGAFILNPAPKPKPAKQAQPFPTTGLTMPMRIAMIGAGSIGFTRGLMRELLSVPEFADTQFALTDISEDNLDKVAQLCRRDIEANALPAKVEATTDRRRAIAGADYVLCMIRQGGLEAFKSDVEIPLRYGVDQCVGDTICAGGIMYAQRTIPALLDFCKDIRQLAKPGALFINYSNPMAMNTWACNKYGKVPTIGLCHGVQGAHWQITRAVNQWAKTQKLVPADYEMHRSEVDVVFAGINHQTWCTKASWRGRDMIPTLYEKMSAVEEFQKTERVRLDVLKRFGYYSTESNGHLSEYLPWYRKRIGEINQWIDLSSWINGETGGYLRVCIEGRHWFETDFPNWLNEKPPTIPGKRGEEHASWIIEGLETGRVYRGHFNVINNNHITNLPNGCVIEIPGYVDRTGINMPTVGDLPLACAATCSASVRVQEMGVEAAVHGDVTLLKQAMLHDPLVGAVCNPEEVWQMTDEMLVAQAEWLPQYAGEIEPARKRLAEAECNGTRVKLSATKGAARLKTHSVEEMQSDRAAARANAGAAEKGKMTVSA